MATINRVREKQKHSSMEQFNHEDRVYTVIGKRTKGICGKATFFILTKKNEIANLEKKTKKCFFQKRGVEPDHALHGPQRFGRYSYA